jgi:hypothetical protein
MAITSSGADIDPISKFNGAAGFVRVVQYYSGGVVYLQTYFGSLSLRCYNSGDGATSLAARSDAISQPFSRHSAAA